MVWNKGSRLGAPTSTFSIQTDTHRPTTPSTIASQRMRTPPAGSLPPKTSRLVDAAPTRTMSAAYSSHRPTAPPTSVSVDACESGTMTAGAAPGFSPTPKVKTPVSTWPSSDETESQLTE